LEAIPLKCNQSIRTVRNLPVYESVGIARRKEAAQLICGGASWAGSNRGSPALLVIEISQLAKSVDPENVNV
jgi:hypothetical protein